MAIGAMRAAHEAGRRGARRAGVVGFDDIVRGRAWSGPPLTTVALPAYEIGRRPVSCCWPGCRAGRPPASRRARRCCGPG